MTDPIALASSVRKNAYCPYSDYSVGASIEFEANGEIFVESGCNVENASYGLANCAERSAVFAAVSKHGKIVIRRVVVATRDGGAPCGACRQVISEFADTACEVVLVDGSGRIERIAFADLFPHGFDSRNLD